MPLPFSRSTVPVLELGGTDKATVPVRVGVLSFVVSGLTVTAGGAESNVRDRVFDAALPLLNLGARVPVCGFIAHYNDMVPTAGPDKLPRLLATVLQKRVRMQGFIILDHYGERFEAFQRDMQQWVAQGRVKLHEEVVDGLEQAPQAFIGLLEGRYLGKVMLRVAAP